MSGTQVTTNMISLIPNNGTEFSVKSGQKVIFEVPPDVGYVKGRDSYLTMDVKNTTSVNRRIGLSNVAGGQALINRIFLCLYIYIYCGEISVVCVCLK